MRSHTTSDLAGRCKRCWLREEYCACALIPSLVTRTRVVVIRHAREAWKSTNSARWATLALPSCGVWDYSGRGSVEERLAELGPAHLLFPEEVDGAGPSTPLGTNGETTTLGTNGGADVLVVLDGTWRQTRRMLNHSPRLQALPRYGLPRTAASFASLRGQHLPDGRSTIEAIALALGQLEGPEITAALLQMHAELVTRVHKARGAFKPEG